MINIFFKIGNHIFMDLAPSAVRTERTLPPKCQKYF